MLTLGKYTAAFIYAISFGILIKGNIGEKGEFLAFCLLSLLQTDALFPSAISFGFLSLDIALKVD